MEIVKKFDIEMAHIVRNAWSTRCSQSIHGHTYTIEVGLERVGETLFDTGRMVVDFGLVKRYIGPFIDSFDHATLLWSKDPDPHVVKFFMGHFDRVIVCDESSSCEMMSAVLLVGIQKILDTILADMPIVCTRVIVHETKTGRAECGKDSDWIDFAKSNRLLETLQISHRIQSEWSEEFKSIFVNTGIGQG
jgi:6-pyruvoyltetrahydropterin/6-carboxytetrahydropterin synthase